MIAYVKHAAGSLRPKLHVSAWGDYGDILTQGMAEEAPDGPAGHVRRAAPSDLRFP
jgi:hypothetical protein